MFTMQARLPARAPSPGSRSRGAVPSGRRGASPPFRQQIGMLGLLQQFDEGLLSPEGEASEQVDQTVGVAGDEIHRAVLEGWQTLLNAFPPLLDCPLIIRQG